jgi:hypothetical protein
MRREGNMFFIQEYFSEFRNKIKRLDELFKATFEEEAWTLCVVYIDQLASGRYYDGQEKNHENFCRALLELSGDHFFGMIHPRQLSDEAQKRDQAIRDVVSQFVKSHPGQFIAQETLKQFVQQSSLAESVKSCLIANLWRASVASICYERIRCQAVHGPGWSSTLTFDNTTYDGTLGATVDYGRLRDALYGVLREVESLSLQSGEWFGSKGTLDGQP